MPRHGEGSLPYIHKMEFYKIYKLEFSRLFLKETDASLPYFLTVWKGRCNYMKLQKVPLVHKCPVYQRFRSLIKAFIDQGLNTTELKSHKNAHIAFLSRCIRQHRKKTELAKDEPEDYISLLIDVAKQTNVLLHRFLEQTKDERERGYRIQLIFLEHAPVCHLRLFKMTDNHAIGKNHVVETTAGFKKRRKELSGFLGSYSFNLTNVVEIITIVM